MASYQKVYYCKNCKTNVSVDKNTHCKKCGGTQLNMSWSVRFRYINENQQEVQKRLSGYETKRECQDEYEKFMATAKKYVKLEKEAHKLTFSKLYDEYKAFQSSRLKESSYYDLCSKCELHILPYFKDYEVKKITPKILLDWQNSISTYKEKKSNTIKQYSYKYKSTLRTYLNSIFNYGYKYYDIPNQLSKVDKFRNVGLKKEMLFWTPEEFNLFIDNVDNPVYKAFFYALYYTGARKGEILATTWDDWDLERNILNINKSVTKKVYGASFLVTKPKNQGSVRSISIPPILTDVMKNFKVGNENNKFVFYQDKPLADSNVDRIKLEACKKANVKNIRIHDFRHSHASLLLGNGASIVAVAKRLGHTDTQQTLNTYAHLLPREDEYIIKILQNTKQ